MYQLLWLFFIYAFLGWCVEVSYAALKTGTFVNRGFLNGPLCPIYGFGVIIVLGCLTPLKNNLFILFVGSVILTSILEGLTGFLLEKIFRQRWWDYSDEPFNIGGYICLRFSIAWGFACVFVVDIIHPAIQEFILIIPHLAGIVILAVFGVTTAVDLLATISTIAKMNHRLKQIDELAAQIKEISNDFGEDLSTHVLKAAELGVELKDALHNWIEENQEHQQERVETLHMQLQEWYEKLHMQFTNETFGQRRLLKAFPQLRSTEHGHALKWLRNWMENRRTEK